jgi:hypothetical protein
VAQAFYPECVKGSLWHLVRAISDVALKTPKGSPPRIKGKKPSPQGFIESSP